MFGLVVFLLGNNHLTDSFQSSRWKSVSCRYHDRWSVHDYPMGRCVRLGAGDSVSLVYPILTLGPVRTFYLMFPLDRHVVPRTPTSGSVSLAGTPCWIPEVWYPWRDIVDLGVFKSGDRQRNWVSLLLQVGLLSSSRRWSRWPFWSVPQSCTFYHLTKDTFNTQTKSGTEQCRGWRLSKDRCSGRVRRYRRSVKFVTKRREQD